MNASDKLDDLLHQHQEIRRMMPRAWNPFFAGFGSLRPIQLQAMPPILSGRNVLVTAPTAGGKTQAVVAPICERLSQQNWPGLSVLVITPTRALVNDLFQRLSGPLDQMQIRLGRKTADHGLSDQIVDQVLITTPESTESLLTFRREALESINAIVLDEIHLLDGSPRGDQLRAVLNRLSALRYYVGGPQFIGIQRIAMSATVSNPRRLADVYLGPDASIVKVPGQRQLEAKTILAVGTDKDRAEAAVAATSGFDDIRKMLVFVNSRKQVDTGASFFQCGRFSSVPVYGHHGSLARSEREETESRFKADHQAICVATMTLEVGIDIGDIDLVICLDPPFSLSSFLQRIGRGCRRLNGLTRVLCVARDRAGELIFESLIRQAAVGVPPEPVPPFRRSVLLQQVLAYLRQVPKNSRVREQFFKILCSSAEPQVREDCVEGLLADMLQEGFLDRQSEVYRPASKGWDFIESNRIYGNIQASPLEVALVDVDTGKIVASVAAVPERSKGVRIAGRSYEVLPGGSGTIKRVRGAGEHDGSPKYHARLLPYAFDIGASLAGRFGIEPNTLVTFHVGDGIVVMTWLGRLLNSILAESITRRGIKVTSGSFHLAIGKKHIDDVLVLFQKTIEDVTENNPLDRVYPERLIDIGPHFKRLSPSEQTKAREDWLPLEFLNNWVKGIKDVRIVDVNSPEGMDLISLT
ncbi:MAG: DEAD/DEAH box helicase [Planctomycetaceae bacterium]|nr:DEAD/DEAH box helicase [Planctomycetaceae bacterium]